jgi:hypothetical protein
MPPQSAPPTSTPTPPREKVQTARYRAWYLLLIPPYVGMLWVPFYNRIEPRVGSFPFFYWYQFAWIGISAILTAVVYFATRSSER